MIALLQLLAVLDGIGLLAIGVAAWVESGRAEIDRVAQPDDRDLDANLEAVWRG